MMTLLSDSMFCELGWERLLDGNQHFKAFMMYKPFHSLAPQYSTRKFKYVRDNYNCNTRQAAAGQLVLPPLTHIECFKSSFSYSEVELWKSIDSTVRNSQDIVKDITSNSDVVNLQFYFVYYLDVLKYFEF